MSRDAIVANRKFGLCELPMRLCEDPSNISGLVSFGAAAIYRTLKTLTK